MSGAAAEPATAAPGAGGGGLRRSLRDGGGGATGGVDGIGGLDAAAMPPAALEGAGGREGPAPVIVATAGFGGRTPGFGGSGEGGGGAASASSELAAVPLIRGAEPVWTARARGGLGRGRADVDVSATDGGLSASAPYDASPSGASWTLGSSTCALRARGGFGRWRSDEAPGSDVATSSCSAVGSVLTESDLMAFLARGGLGLDLIVETPESSSRSSVADPGTEGALTRAERSGGRDGRGTGLSASPSAGEAYCSPTGVSSPDAVPRVGVSTVRAGADGRARGGSGPAATGASIPVVL